MWIVRVALDRPYTFIVLALLILILSPVVILRTPTDIFPNINIPVDCCRLAVYGPESGGTGRTAYQRIRAAPDLNGRQYRAHRIDHGERSSNRQNLSATWHERRYSERSGNGNFPVRFASATTWNLASADHQLQRFQRADFAARA